MYIYEMQKEQKLLAEKIDMLQKEIAKLPEGELLCTRNGNYTKWYLSNGSRPIYIPKKERKKAEKLAKRKSLTVQLKTALLEKEAIDRYLEEHSRRASDSLKLLEELSRYHELLVPQLEDISLYAMSDSNQLEQWQSEECEHNRTHPENLIHRTLAGHCVRSKSEVIIANALFQYGVPYRYECALHCDSITLFPDFTICHPKTLKIYYWEHFGLMDKPSYVDHACSKLRIYAQQNIIPTMNLITTYETASYPLDSGRVDKVIRELLL